jgi:hypothetical protein
MCSAFVVVSCRHGHPPSSGEKGSSDLGSSRESGSHHESQDFQIVHLLLGVCPYTTSQTSKQHLVQQVGRFKGHSSNDAHGPNEPPEPRGVLSLHLAYEHPDEEFRPQVFVEIVLGE